MYTRWKILCLLTLALLLFPGDARSQTASDASPPPQNIAVPWKVNTLLMRPSNFQFTESEQPMLNELLREVKPAEIAAAAFNVPIDKIELVPHVYWREAKWADWAAKADQAKGPGPSFGPDGKLVMAAEISPIGQLEFEFGPVPWKNSADVAKFPTAAEQVLQRVAAKMVRLAPEFSVDFKRQQLAQNYDRIGDQLRKLNVQIQDLRSYGDAGLSQAQLAEQLADLDKQQLSMRMSMEVMKARARAIREQIEKLKAEATASAEHSEGRQALRRIVELRRERYKNLQQQKSQGIVSQAEVDKAEEEMLSAMVELDRATTAQQKDAQQVQLDQFSTELNKLAIDRAEAEARLQLLNEAASENKNAFAKRREMDARDDEIRSRLTALERRRSQLQQQRNQAEDAMNSPIEPLQITLQER